MSPEAFLQLGGVLFVFAVLPDPEIDVHLAAIGPQAILQGIEL